MTKTNRYAQAMSILFTYLPRQNSHRNYPWNNLETVVKSLKVGRERQKSRAYLLTEAKCGVEDATPANRNGNGNAIRCQVQP